MKAFAVIVGAVITLAGLMLAWMAYASRRSAQPPGWPAQADGNNEL